MDISDSIKHIRPIRTQKRGNEYFKWLVLALVAIGCSAKGQTVQGGQYYAGTTFYQPVTIQGIGLTQFYHCVFWLSTGNELTVGQYQSVYCYECTFLQGPVPAYGQQAAQGISAENAYRLWVYGCTFDGLARDIYSDGNWCLCDTWIDGNNFWHQNLKFSDGAGGWLNSSGWGPAVSIANTRGWNPSDGSWHTIVANNTFFNELGIDEPSDQINLYESSGVLVLNNDIYGAKGLYGAYAQRANGIVTDDLWSDAYGNDGDPGESGWTTYECVISGNHCFNACIALWAGYSNTVQSNVISNTNRTLIPYGIARYIPEGTGWASTNVVQGNLASNYANQAGPINWTGNKEF